MRRMMIFQHVGHEPLGTLNPMLKAAGFRIRYVNFGRAPSAEPSIEGYNGLVVLGGPMGVYESKRYTHLTHEMRQIEYAFKLDIPVLGICLGAQLIAEVLGGRVRKAPEWELGWYGLHLTDQGKQHKLFGPTWRKEKIFQIHQDTFDIPTSATHLAYSDLYPGQVFCYGDKVFGLQFHLEVDHAMIKRWLVRPENQKIIYESHGHFDERRLEEDTQNLITRSLELSAHTFGQFIDLFQLPDRPLILGSTR